MVSAEIPGKTKTPNLYETIIKLNIHTPCTNTSYCNENGRCLKRFPRKFTNQTYEDENLSSKYNAHINVEICTTVKACKYLYKYVYKGNDKIVHAVTDRLSKFMLVKNYFLNLFIIDEITIYRI